MPKILIEKLPTAAKIIPDAPGMRVTLDLPEIPADVETWQDLLDWFTNNPDFFALLLAAIMALLGGSAQPRKAT